MAEAAQQGEQGGEEEGVVVGQAEEGEAPGEVEVGVEGTEVEEEGVRELLVCEARRPWTASLEGRHRHQTLFTSMFEGLGIPRR